jgi:hypothetical protein
MSRYKELQRSGFSGCTLLHEGVDPHRNRPARYYALPGEFGLIGYSDGTDTFLIPVSGFVPREATGALDKIRNGERFVYKASVVEPVLRRRQRVVEEPQPEQPRRRQFHG